MRVKAGIVLCLALSLLGVSQAGAQPIDSDADGVPDSTESPGGVEHDTDGDGEMDFVDPDDDGDGIPTIAERPDGIELDLDRDAVPNYLDPDDDGDALMTLMERPEGVDRDTDADLAPDHHDADDDGDGVPTRSEARADTDGDGRTDWMDPDADGDGYFDGDEPEGGMRDPAIRPLDIDGDLLPDDRERAGDSDNDGTLDVSDVDDDGDSVETRVERPSGDRDTDGDAVPNHWDTDDDGDGVPTLAERPDGVDRDTDLDGTPDYLDPDLAPVGSGLAGGACSIAPGGAGTALGWIALVAAGLLIASRRRRTGAGRRVALAAVVSVALFFLGAVTAGAQPRLTLDQYHPGETPSDGFVISRPLASEPMTFGGTLVLEYANDPLVFELTQGDRDTEAVAVVSDQMVAHANLSFAFHERFLVFAQLPTTLWMDGGTYATAPLPEADGTNVGDFTLGGRFLIAGGRPDDHYGFAAQLSATAPTARLFDDTETWVGERRLMGTPKLIGEVRVGVARVTGNVGLRLRSDAEFGSARLRVTDEFVYGVGVGVPLGADELVAQVELFGATDLERSFERETSPMEVLGGLRFEPADGLVLGAGAGAGLLRGYGSPDYRVMGTVGYAPPPPERSYGDAGMETDIGGSRSRHIREVETERETEDDEVEIEVEVEDRTVIEND